MVNRFALSVVLGSVSFAVAGCASQPKPCTAEWVDWKTDRFFDEFVRDHREDIVDLRNATAHLDPSGKRDAADYAALAVAGAKVLGLAGDFLSDTVPATRQALAQCGTAPKATQLFASLLRREGFSDSAVKAVEDLGVVLDRDS
jgi:hypothetical protein